MTTLALPSAQFCATLKSTKKCEKAPKMTKMVLFIPDDRFFRNQDIFLEIEIFSMTFVWEIETFTQLKIGMLVQLKIVR